MRRGGVAKALVDVATGWFGQMRGALGLVTVVSCTLFAAICGSSVATALAMGTILVPAMIERGYPRHFALGVVGASGTIGIVIPPSLSLILYGLIAEQSVPRLFPGRHPARAAAGGDLLRLGAVLRLSLQAAARARGPKRHRLAQHVARAAGAVRADHRHGRHLWRADDGHRIRRRRRHDRAGGQPGVLPWVPAVRDAGRDRRRDQERRHHHDHRRHGAGVRPLDDGFRRSGQAGPVHPRPSSARPGSSC